MWPNPQFHADLITFIIRLLLNLYQMQLWRRWSIYCAKWRIWTQLDIKKLTSSITTAWKVSRYGLISGPYFPVFGLKIGKYGPEITPYLDTFHAVYKINLALQNKLIRRLREILLAFPLLLQSFWCLYC